MNQNQEHDSCAIFCRSCKCENITAIARQPNIFYGCKHCELEIYSGETFIEWKQLNPSPHIRFKPELADQVSHPAHYNHHPSGIECIQITEHMNFNLGNAFKYIWRADLKNNATQDLEKARWYIDRELQKRAPKEAKHAK